MGEEQPFGHFSSPLPAGFIDSIEGIGTSLLVNFTEGTVVIGLAGVEISQRIKSTQEIR